MKKFLLKVALFFFPLFVFFVLAPAIDWALRTRISFELPKDKTVLFIGHSHIERGVNDKIIPHSFNNANSADFYLNMFPRIRKLLEANPQIHTVFIATSPNSLSPNSDTQIFEGDGGLLIRLGVVFYNSEERTDSWKAIVSAFKGFRETKIAIERLIKGRSAKIKELGGFKEKENTNSVCLKQIEDPKTLREKIRRYQNGSCNALTLKYLRKIVEFVRARGARVIFINPPIYHSKEFFNIPYFESVLKENFPDVEFWDYADFPIPDEYFWDFNHLNGKGAEIFSKELARRMQDEGIIDPTPETESH